MQRESFLMFLVEIWFMLRMEFICMQKKKEMNTKCGPYYIHRLYG